MKRLILMLCATIGLVSGCASIRLHDTRIHKGQTVHTVLFSLKYPIDSPEANKVLLYAEENLMQIPGLEDFQILRQPRTEVEGFQYRMTMLFTDKASLELFERHVLRKRVVEELHKHRMLYNEYDFVTFDYRRSLYKK